MKLPVLCTFAILASIGATHAGSFGGPPPFTDQSPLQSGIDGSYQATARGTNLTGVIRFAYSNGVQSSQATANQYQFFVNGEVVSGGVTASITAKELAGVLGGSDFSVPSNSNGSTELPIVFIVRGNRANGQFTGQMNLEDPMAAFNGKGTIGPAPTETNTVILIQTNNLNNALIIADSNSSINSQDVTVTPFVVNGSNITPSNFTFEGVRTSVFSQSTGVASTTSDSSSSSSTTSTTTTGQ